MKIPFMSVRHRYTLALLVITLLGGAIRLAVLEMTSPQRLLGDEHYYVEVAGNIAAGRGHLKGDSIRAERAPGHPYLLSLAVGDAPDSDVPDPAVIKRMLRIQVGLSTLLVFLVGVLGTSFFDSRVGVFSAIVTAVYPTFIGFSHYLWAQPLYSVLMVSALILALRLRAGAHTVLAAFCGLVLGAASLTREITIPIAMLIAAWLFTTAPRELRMRAFKQGAIMLALAAFVVLPWTYRNYRLFERFVPVSTLGTFAVHEGNSFREKHWIHITSSHMRPFRRAYFAIDDEVERMAFAKQENRAQFDGNWPRLVYRKAIRTFSLMLTPDSFIFKKVSNRRYASLNLARFRVVLILTIAAYLAVAAAGAFGIASANQGNRLLACLVFCVLTAIHFFTSSNSRYRVPWMPMIIPFAVYAVCEWRNIRARAGWRIWPAAVLVLLLLGWCLPFFLPDAISLWKTGRYTDAMR